MKKRANRHRVTSEEAKSVERTKSSETDDQIQGGKLEPISTSPLAGFDLCAAATFENTSSNCQTKLGLVVAVSAIDTIRIPDCQFREGHSMFHAADSTTFGSSHPVAK
ncbi:MAG: hypothetical protein CV081_07785 [Nitrospira sp. LK265]|nr:hypothetical protein [Nitrospira sp. LK265]